MKVYNEIFNTINKNNLIKKNDFILVGLSGGADSVCLFKALLQYKKIVDFQLETAHVNHGIRGNDALEDEMFSKRLSEENNIKFHVFHGDMEKLAKELKISSEDAGRKMRYSFFDKILADHYNGKIAVAHHMSDQAETILMNIIRGSGLDGLSAMSYRNGNIIRPLLDINRDEVEKILEKTNQNYCNDITNQDIKYRRNLVRQEVIPYFKKNINPNIEKTLFRMGEILESDLMFLDEYVEKLSKDIIYIDEDIFIKKDIFLKESIAIQRRIIRKALFILTGSYKDLSFDMINSIIQLFSSSEQKEYMFSDYKIYSSYNKVVFTRKEYNVCIEDKKSNKYYINNDIKQFYFGKYLFNIGVINRDEYIKRKSEKNIYFFNSNIVNENLILRFREPGDRFKPFGMNGIKKLKKYFIDEKIPKDEREKIPLLVDYDNRILAIIGYKRSNSFKLDKNSREVFFISYEVQRDGK